MKRKILVFMLGLFIFVSSGCDNENISIENNGSLDLSILNESTYNTNESKDQ